MTKRYLAIALTMLLLLPALVFAANMQVTSSCAPVSGGSISPLGFKSVGTFQNYSVTTRAGFALTNVTLTDVTTLPYPAPVVLSPIGGHPNIYQVPFVNAGVGASAKFKVVATFSTNALLTITTSVPAIVSPPAPAPPPAFPGGGQIQVTGGAKTSIVPGSTRNVIIAPASGYRIASITDNTVTVPIVNPTAAQTISYSPMTASHAIVATFTLTPPNVVVYAGPNFTGIMPAGFFGGPVQDPATGLDYNLRGTVNPDIATGWVWSLEAGSAPGASFGTPNAKTTTLIVPAIGVYKVAVTATVGGLPYKSNTASITVVYPGVLNAGSKPCIGCHASSDPTAPANAYPTSVHAIYNQSCSGCHTHTMAPQCNSCHSDAFYLTPSKLVPACAACHTSSSPHAVTLSQSALDTTCTTLCHTNHLHTTPAVTSCIACHNVAIQHIGNVVNDNNGVRAITTEFAKWSHHVTGVTLNDAHCAACHLEGTVGTGADAGKIVPDPVYHMADATTHLRNADSDVDMVWNPEVPNHATMDNFCMSCHDAGGATSAGSIAIQALINAVGGTYNTGVVASATNPFGDTISNQYDKMLRGRVVNVDEQFNTANYSHHAVKGKKYSGRTRTAGPRQIDNPSTFASYSGALVFANTSSTMGTLDGTRETIYEAARFVSTYRTLSPAVIVDNIPDYTLGDDSVLHCGDCHTVGQWKPGSSVNVDGTPTVAAIGAHGSNNEYMLRVSNGADVLHRGAQYSYNPANMLGKNVAPIANDSSFDYSATNGVPAANVAGNFAGMTFGPFPTGLPHALVNIANQAVPATEVPESQPFLVCYNCHVYTEYGSVYFSNTAQGGREGSHTFGDHTRGNYCNGPYNTSGSGRVSTYTAVYGPQVSDVGPTGKTFMGVANFNYGRLQPGVATVNPATGSNFSGATNTAAVWCSATVLNNLELKTQGQGFGLVYDLRTGALAVANSACNDPSGATGTLSKFTTTQLAFQGMNGSGNGGGNIFQIQCNSCHNSGPNNGFGGIHGSKINTYTDAAGQTTNNRRFLPGLGNVKWVPGDPGAVEAMQWEQEANANQKGSHQPGCYTLNTSGGPGGNAPLPAPSEGGTTPGTNTGQLFGTWGSCTDHATVDGLERTMIRPVSY